MAARCYDVILADPPWRYRAWSGKPYGDGSRTAESHYPTMSFDELVAMRSRIDAWAADDCALFLWATFPTIADAIDLIDAWDFRYVTAAFIWVKTTKDGRPATGLGHYTRANAEPCLLAVRGRMPVEDRAVNSVVISPRLRHSAKPTEVRRRIERLYPRARRIELFARDRAPEWDAWGLEAPKTITRTTA